VGAKLVGPTLNISSEEKIMFTFESMVEAYTKGAKQLNSFVTHAEFRKNLDTLVDRQAEFAQGAYETGTSATKTVQETITKMFVK
jgi:hypothetical protein